MSLWCPSDPTWMGPFYSWGLWGRSTEKTDKKPTISPQVRVCGPPFVGYGLHFQLKQSISVDFESHRTAAQHATSFFATLRRTVVTKKKTMAAEKRKRTSEKRPGGMFFHQGLLDPPPRLQANPTFKSRGLFSASIL